MILNDPVTELIVNYLSNRAVFVIRMTILRNPIDPLSTTII